MMAPPPMPRLRPALAPLAVALVLVGAAPARAADGSGPISTDDPRGLHAISVFGHGQFVPNFLLSVGLQKSTELSSGGFGASYTFARGTFHVVTTIDYTFANLPDGNFLAVGTNKKAEVDTHYVQFKNLSLLSLDVSFYWVRDINRYFAFMVGGGIGLGFLLGDVTVTNNSGCTDANASDTSMCHPVVVPGNYTSVNDPAPTWTDAAGKVQTDFNGGSCAKNPSTCLSPADPDYQRKLDGLTASQNVCKAKAGTTDCRDTQLHPYTHGAAEKPSVVPVINFQIGFKLKLHRHFNVNVMGGFRDGFVVGGGPEFVF
jgi:hypothetical protein